MPRIDQLYRLDAPRARIGEQNIIISATVEAAISTPLGMTRGRLERTCRAGNTDRRRTEKHLPCGTQTVKDNFCNRENLPRQRCLGI